MTQEQWEKLLATIDGEVLDPLPVGFIIDSPWLPGWAGMSMMDYYASEQQWLAANLKVVERFADVLFLPGFWAEYGMCTEPSAFGARCVWHENEFPFAEPVAANADEAAALDRPDPAIHGLLPLAIKRLQQSQHAISQSGHAIRMATSRGPLNIASFLMGSTELVMAIRLDPDRVHAVLSTVTDFLVDWLKLQAKTFPTIDGVFLLDDIVGFLGDDDCRQFALPYLKRAFDAVDAKVRFFHNDASGKVCAPYLSQLGINLFNFSFEHSLAEMKQLVGDEVTLLGNIPPRDVLAAGTPDEVATAVQAAVGSVQDRSRIIFSCGGGVPPDVPTENIDAFITASRT